MRVRSLIIATVIFVVTADAISAGRSPARDADYLSPVDPYPGDWHVRYTDELRRRLEPPLHTFAQMLVSPAFEGEYSVSLHGIPDDLEFGQASKFFLSYYAADKSIWYSMPENNEEKKQRNVAISVTKVEFPSELAQRVYKVWRTMLLRTRYFEDTSIRLDATKVEFSSGGMYGETFDPPEAESPAYLIELGHRLIAYCKAPSDKQGDAAKSIEIQAKALEKYLKRYPPK